MDNQSVTKSNVISWAGKALDNLNFIDYEISVAGTTEKGEGYTGDLVFVTANGTTRDKKKGVVGLVVKHGKSSKDLRKIVPIRSTFETEIQVYEKIYPAFEKFQLQKHVKEVFDSLPKCYFTLILDQMEVLVLENLKPSGYTLCDRQQTMNFHHLKLVLKEYGKLHALSFALKDQNADEFNRISSFGSNPWIKYWQDKSFGENFNEGVVYAINILREKGHEGLCKKFEDLLSKKAGDLMLDMIEKEEPQSIIIHGDCWNNNFMFKYEGDDRNSPSSVKILDWQLSGLRSPVFDLSYFIYANSSQKELGRFDELVESYYVSFSDFLKQLGSNPEQLFTFEDLRSHWKKYGASGFLLMTVGLKIPLCNKEEAPVTEEIRDLGGFMEFKISNIDAYYERLIAITSHYFEHEF